MNHEEIIAKVNAALDEKNLNFEAKRRPKMKAYSEITAVRLREAKRFARLMGVDSKAKKAERERNWREAQKAKAGRG